MILRIKLCLVAREAEIAQFNTPVIVDEHILALEIAVEELSLMKVEKGHSNLFSDLGDSRVIQY